MKEIKKEVNKNEEGKRKKFGRKLSLVIAAAAAVVTPTCSNPADTLKQEVAVDNVGGADIYLNGVSAADAAQVISYIRGIYESWGGGSQADWGTRVTRINIVSGSTATGTGVLNIGKDISAGDLSIFMGGVVACLQMENTIRLAGQFDNSKETIRLSMANVRAGRTA